MSILEDIQESVQKFEEIKRQLKAFPDIYVTDEQTLRMLQFKTEQARVETTLTSVQIRVEKTPTEAHYTAKALQAQGRHVGLILCDG